MDKITLLSLSNDLKRITTSIQRGSFENSKRFSTEAKRWIAEIQDKDDPYLKKLLSKIEKSLNKKDSLEKAEDCLMYSVLTQNKALYISSN
ncbi:hypothetical protein HY024_05085 [Candidatus Curtissbacteria bacterium]|nr:hypothetical protein [Candidatus Curtissbacteria bacterium]